MPFQGLTFGICGFDHGTWQKIEDTVAMLGGRFILKRKGLPSPVDYIVSTDGCVEAPAGVSDGRYVSKERNVKYVHASWVSICHSARGTCCNMSQPSAI